MPSEPQERQRPAHQDDLSRSELGAQLARRPISVPPGRPVGEPPAGQAVNLKILRSYLTFIHYFGYSINPSDDDSAQARRLSIRAKMAAASTAASVRRRLPNLVGGRPSGARSRNTLEPASWRWGRGAAGWLARWWRKSNWRPLKCCIKFYAISLTAFLTANHVIVLFHYIYDGQKVFTELLLELRLVITKLSALIFVVSWHRNQTKVRQLIKLVKSTSLYILSEPAPLAGRWASGCKQGRTGDRPDFEAGRADWRIRRLDWRVAKWWLMCSSITLLHFSLSEAEIRTAQHLWQWLEDYSLHQLNNQTTSISSLFIMASYDNYIYTVHVYGTRLIGASVMCIVCTFQIENILYLDEQVLAALRATNAPASSQTGGPTRRSRVLDRELFYVLGESDWLQVERNRHRSPPIGWLSSTLERQCASLRAKSAQLAKCLVTTLAGAAGPSSKVEQPREPAADFVMQINRVTPTELSPTLASACKPTQLAVPDGQAGLQPVPLIAQQKGGDGAGQFRATSDFVAGSMRRAAGDQDASAPKPRPTPISWRLSAAARAADCEHSNQAAHQARHQLLLPALSSPPSERALAEQLARASQVAPSSGGRHFEGPLARARRLFAPTISIAAAPSTLWTTADQLHSHLKSPACRSEAQKQHRAAQALGQQLELHLDTMARKYELIRTVNSRIDNCFGRMLLSQYSFLFLMSCIDVVYFSLSFNPKTKTKYIIVSGMILLWFPYLLLYKFASDIGLASKKLLTSVRRLARLALMLQLSVGGAADPSGCSGGHACDSDKLQLLTLPSLRRYRLGSIAGKLAAELANHGQHHHTTRARIFNKLDHVFKPSHLSIVGVMTMDKFFLLNFAKIVITASVMAIQFISKG